VVAAAAAAVEVEVVECSIAFGVVRIVMGRGLQAPSRELGEGRSEAKYEAAAKEACQEAGGASTAVEEERPIHRSLPCVPSIRQSRGQTDTSSHMGSFPWRRSWRKAWSYTARDL